MLKSLEILLKKKQKKTNEQKKTFYKSFIRNGIVNFIRHSRNEKISDAGGVFELETEASEYPIAQRQKMAKLQEVYNVAFELLVEK